MFWFIDVSWCIYHRHPEAIVIAIANQIIRQLTHPAGEMNTNKDKNGLPPTSCSWLYHNLYRLKCGGLLLNMKFSRGSQVEQNLAIEPNARKDEYVHGQSYPCVPLRLAVSLHSRMIWFSWLVEKRGYDSGPGRAKLQIFSHHTLA